MEDRSLGSKVTEKLIKDRPILPRTREEYRKHLESKGENDFVIPPLFVGVIKVERYQDIPVYRWNDNGLVGQKIILYLHGGGYLYNPLRSQFDSLHEISKRTDSMVVMPIYRKIPKYTFRDSYPVLLSLYASLKMNYPKSPIVLMGDSAGGGLALGLAQVIAGQGRIGPDKIVLLSPWLDVKTDNPLIEQYQPLDPLLEAWKLQVAGEMWAGGLEQMTNPMVSPIYGNMSGLGRITIFVGTREIFYPDVMQLHERLLAEGIDHDLIVGEGQNHVYPLYPIKEGREARNRIVEIINK